jgi:5-hydroxyisourate hydrolase-like protein (transthyretin family)
MGGLTTHVLDTASGRPAAGVRLVLRALSAADEGQQITETTTNADGRSTGRSAVPRRGHDPLGIADRGRALPVRLNFQA